MAIKKLKIKADKSVLVKFRKQVTHAYSAPLSVPHVIVFFPVFFLRRPRTQAAARRKEVAVKVVAIAGVAVGVGVGVEAVVIATAVRKRKSKIIYVLLFLFFFLGFSCTPIETRACPMTTGLIIAMASCENDSNNNNNVIVNVTVSR